MNLKPMVSVIIASYNHGKYLHQAIDSVLAQTYKNYEIIVVDDASTDNTLEILKPYLAKKCIRYIRNPENLGEAGSRNVGNTAAQGDYIAVLDADDWWYADKLEVQMHIMLENPNCVLGFTGAMVVSDEKCETYLLDKDWTSDIGIRLRLDNQIIHSTVIYARSAVMAVNGYDETLPFAVDWDLWFRLMIHYGEDAFVYIDNPLLYYRIHQSNMSMNIDRNRMGERTVLFRLLVTDEWWIKHPIRTLQAIDNQYQRELCRYKRLGMYRKAAMCAVRRIFLAPIRTWRWKYAFNLMRQSS